MSSLDTTKPLKDDLDTYHGSSFVDEVSNEKKTDPTTDSDEVGQHLKIPELTWYYWAEKMTATTFGETFADFLSQTLELGYSLTSGIFIPIFFVFLVWQMYVKNYHPARVWVVM